MVDTISMPKVYFVLCLLIHCKIAGCDRNVLDAVQYFNKEFNVEFNLLINLNLNHSEQDGGYNELIGNMDLPKLIITREKSAVVKNLYKHFNMQILTFARVRMENWNATLNLIDGLLWKCHFTPIVFDWWPGDDILSHVVLHLFFNECWQKGFTKTVLWHNGSIFTYHPYPIIEVRSIAKLEDILSVWHWTSLGYSDIRIPIVEFPPRCFSYRHRNGTQMISGDFYKIIQTFVKHYNGNLKITHFNLKARLTHKEIQQEIAEKGYSFLTTHVNKNAEVRDYYADSDSLGVASNRFLVPTGSEIHQSLYILISFSGKLWLTVSLVFISFAALICLTRLRTSQRPDIARSIFNALRLMIFVSIEGFERRTVLNFLLHLIFLMNGLFTTNLYGGNLCSMYTSRIYESNMKTLSEIGKTNLKIHGFSLDTALFKTMDNLPKIVFQRLLFPNDSAFHSNRQNLNMSYMYYGYDHTLDFLLFQQSYLKRPFAIALPDTFWQESFAITMSLRSPLLERFNWYLGRIRDSGIYQKFIADTQWDGVMSGIIHFFIDDEINRSLSLSFFQYAFVVWFLGLLAALLCFLYELIRWNKAIAFVREFCSRIL